MAMGFQGECLLLDHVFLSIKYRLFGRRLFTVSQWFDNFTFFIGAGIREPMFLAVGGNFRV
jgi:hypothetical protein